MVALWACVAVLASVCVAGPPAEMQAAAMLRRSSDFKFHVENVGIVNRKVPVPGRGEVLVAVEASNVNPVDHKIVELAGWLWKYPHQLGIDLAGVVVAVGSDCNRIQVGDEVWGEATAYSEMVETSGTYAQYAVVSESVLGVKPKSMSMVEAGAMPMVALTGLDSLTWAAKGDYFEQPNVTVLVLGGSGGTGHLGIQLAKAMGASRVITTCSSSHFDFVRSLGADEAIDYHTQNYYDVLEPKSIDVVYDCVGLRGTGDHALGLLKDRGSFATLLVEGMPSLRARFRRPDVRTKAPLCVGSCSRYDRIDQVAGFVDQGLLKVHIDAGYALADIQQAFNHSLSGHTTGKVSVQIALREVSV